MPRVQQKRGTAANLTAVDPTPLAGELLVVTDENTLVIGNGTDAYTSLAYVTATPRSHTHPLSEISDLNIKSPGSPMLPYDVALSYNYVTGTWATKEIGLVGVGGEPAGGWPTGSLGAALADLSTPTAHKSTHAMSGSDPLFWYDIGASSATHAAEHAVGGSDVLTPAAIGAAPAASPTFTGTATFGQVSFLTFSLADGATLGDFPDNVVTPYIFTTNGAGSDFGGQAGHLVLQPRTNANRDIIFAGGSPTTSELVRIVGGSGRVGIGRTSPATALDVNGVITVAAGTAAAPALVFSGDPNTGIAQLGGADTWSVVTGNSERLRVRADGNIGIGSSGASNIIVTVAGLSSGYGTVINPTFTGAENFATRFQAATPANSTTSAITMVDVYGPVLGSGATLATSRGLHVKSTVAVAANNFGVQLSIGSGAGRWNIYADGTAQNWFAGSVGIGSGKTAPASALDVNGVITVSATSGSAGSYAPSVTFSGDANTGFGQVSGESDTASVFTAGHERVRVKSTGAVRFVPLSADPASGEAGDVYYNSSTNKLRVYNGTSWVDLH